MCPEVEAQGVAFAERAPEVADRVALCLSGMLGDAAPPAPRKAFEPYHSKVVPKSEDLRAADRGPFGACVVTTLMLRNIPNRYAQSTLMQEIDEMGFEGAYDFFYLPMDVQNRNNVGYAFINFTSPASAERFFEMFSEHEFRKHHSRKVSNVSAAHVQGLEANLRHFENRAVRHARNDQYRPVVLSGTRRIDFEDALAALRSGDRSATTTPALEPQCGQGRPLSRQVSNASVSTTSSALRPPPGLELAEPARRPLPDAAGPVLFGMARRKRSDAGAVGPRVERVRALSDGGRVADCDPVYVPLPTIPSASKIFSACHAMGVEDNADYLFDAPWQLDALEL